MEEILEEEEELEGKKKKRRLRFSSSGLKVVGAVFLLIYYISRIVLQNGMMHIADYSSAELTEVLQSQPAMAALSTKASVLQLIGYMAIPIYAFLLAEGFIHTKNFRKYLVGVILLAVVCEIPFDWAVNESLWDLSSQNIVFSSVIALIALYGMSVLDRQQGLFPKIGQALILAAAVLWSLWIRVSFGLGTVVLTSVYYLFRRRRMGRLMIGCALSMIYYSAPLASLILWAYNGEEGWSRGRARYAFYAVYPVILLILGALAHSMG